jgi:hypothetical protein
MAAPPAGPEVLIAHPSSRDRTRDEHVVDSSGDISSRALNDAPMDSDELIRRSPLLFHTALRVYGRPACLTASTPHAEVARESSRRLVEQAFRQMRVWLTRDDQRDYLPR